MAARRVLPEMFSRVGVMSGSAGASAFAADLAPFKPLVLEMQVDGIEPGRLAACGLAVINPPWRFEEAMREALPWVATHLGPGVRATICTPPAV